MANKLRAAAQAVVNNWDDIDHCVEQDHLIAALRKALEQPQQPLSDEQKLELATDWFAEGWEIKKAVEMLDDYESICGITQTGEKP